MSKSEARKSWRVNPQPAGWWDAALVSAGIAVAPWYAKRQAGVGNRSLSDQERTSGGTDVGSLGRK
jgi:hypothetical protein